MLNAGEVIAGRFEVISLLGEGGMARVYRVKHQTLGGEHALKLLSFQHPRLKQRLLREGQIQAQLSHPNVVKVVDVVEHEGRTGLLMEYVDCITLDDLLNQRSLRYDEALTLMAQILAGMTHAHDAGILHRDLKPANVLLAENHRTGGFTAKVTDFGIAKVLEPEKAKGMTRVGALMGTPGYMAPEQARDSASVDERADVFALGILAYEVIAGFPPYIAEDVETAIQCANARDWRGLDAIVHDCPSEVAEAVQRALSIDRDDRYANAHAFGEGLLQLQPTLLTTLRGDSAPPSLSLPGIAVNKHPPTPTLEPPPDVSEVFAVAAPQTRRAWPLAIGLLGLCGVAASAIGLLLGLTSWNASPDPQTAPPAPAEAIDAASAADDTPPQAAPVAQPEPSAVAAPVAPAPRPSPTAEPVPARTERTTTDAVGAPAAHRESAPRAVQQAAPETSPMVADEADAVAIAEAIPPEEPLATDTAIPEKPPAERPPSHPSVIGVWSGTAANRPLQITFMNQVGESIEAAVTILVGPTERTDTYTGTLGLQGALRLEQIGGAMTVFTGRVEGDAIEGTYTARGARRAQTWRVTRD